MQSEISQSQKDKYCMIALTWESWSGQTHGDMSRIVAERGWGQGGMGVSAW
jgi:hypothetical protein